MSCREYLPALPAPPTAPRAFRPNLTVTYQLLTVGAVFLAAGCVAFWFWQQGQLQGRLAAVAFVAPAVGVVLTGMQLWNLLRPLRAALTADGFEVNGEEVTWGEVVAVVEQVNPKSPLDGWKAWVRTRGGRTVRLSSNRLADMPELLAAVHHHTLSRFIAEARAVMAAGEAVSFGPIELSPAGLRAKGRMIGWADLHQVAPDEDGDVAVWTSDGRKALYLSAAKVDNLRVLLTLVDECAVPVEVARGGR
jgi:hypothetical protein